MLNRTALLFIVVSIAWGQQPGDIKTIAGGGRVNEGDGNPATSVVLGPRGIALDGAGNIYLTDEAHNSIRKVDTHGIITTVAGPAPGGPRQSSYTGDGGVATNATMNLPFDVALDAKGNIYIADSQNHAIRKVDTAGIITSIAGNGSPGFSGDGGPAKNAQLNQPVGVKVDLVGNVYIADSMNNRVRKIDRFGTISTVAGTDPSDPAATTADGGLAVHALISVEGVALDAEGNLYFSDTDRIRKVDAAGKISTVAGSGAEVPGFSGDGGLATKANLNLPTGIVFDPAGNLFIGDQNNHRVRKVDAAGIITTVAGGIPATGPPYSGPATKAHLLTPWRSGGRAR